MTLTIYQDCRDLLLCEQLSDDKVQRVLSSVGFTDWRAAHRHLQRMANDSQVKLALADVLPHLLVALASAASPDRVLVSLERLVRSAAERRAMFRYLASNPRAIEVLVTLFDSSQFLTEILLRNPEYLRRLMEHKSLAQRKSVKQFCAEAQAAIAMRSPAGSSDDTPTSDATAAPDGTPASSGTPTSTGGWGDDPLDALRRFQRWEFLRIGACDLLGLFDLPAVTTQLSNLADSLVRACLSIAAAQPDPSLPLETGPSLSLGTDLSPTDGASALRTGPAPADETSPPKTCATHSKAAGTVTDGFVVMAMGKLGGQELNYSSDIDLLFLSASNGPAYRRLGERLIEALTRVTGEGFLYRVDMRLRPWGQVGALVPSLEGYLAYLDEHARSWEKQALLKARAIAGDERVGNEFLSRADPLVYGRGHLVRTAKAIRADVYAMKRRTEAYLRQQGREWGEVKLGEGSIRDVEFVTQYLQLAHGASQPQIRGRNTLEALGQLSASGFLSADEYRVLADGYTFLRTIEHHLQMMHYRQTYTLPSEPEALVQLARRLGFQGQGAGDQFLARYQQHCAAIRAIYLQHLGSDQMENSAHSPSSPPPSKVHRHLARMDPSYAAAFSDREIKLHAKLADQLADDHLVEVDAVPLDDGHWRVTIIGYDYPGELSLICGLLFVYGLSIHDGDVFTYEPEPPSPAPSPQARRRKKRHANSRRKIVDVFTVHPVHGELPAGTWVRYADDLSALLRLMHRGQRREARGKLAKRVAAALKEMEEGTATLYPIGIEIDNTLSDRYTVLRIDTPDTIGFLYEFTNALALHRIYIARVEVDSVGNRVHDTLYVTDANGQKITAPDKQRELRAATVLIKHFTHLLPHSPNPESAMLHFREFLGQLFRHAEWPDELTSLERPEVLHAFARLLGVSDFLWDDFLRMQHENLFPVVRDVDALTTAKSRGQLQAELEAALRPVHDGPQTPSDDAPWRATLNAFKDREMFRVDMRHILGHTKEFGEFSKELTDLAEVVVNAAYHLCHEDLRTQYGTPLLKDRQVSEMAVCALGKCGGRELGFASDIELMFIYAGNGKTTGPQEITTAEFYEKVVQMLVSAIRAKREGIFEIDLQLRPYGKAGSMAVSLEAFRRYFAPHGPAWAYERQALVKLRPIAGNVELGQQVMTLRDAFVYNGEPFDVTAMRAMRERQVRHLVTGGTFNAKYSPGGLVDVEYLVQGLQITHGYRDPSLRLTNIRKAMATLAAAGVLSAGDYTRLRKAHTFLQWLIDALRMVRGNAKDLTVPPADSEAFAFLARRLRYGNDVAQLREDLARYTACVQEQSARLLA
jgi:glutamate-ammonia-ligase adenylyltransferase